MAQITDELIEYKSLLDSGVITQEDFDRKKEELLFGGGNAPEKNGPSFNVDGDVLVSYTGDSPIVEIPEGVRVIGKDCFAYHTEIAEVRFHANSSSISTNDFEIGENAFRGCSSLIHIIDLASEGITVVAKVGKHAFDGCVSLQGTNDGGSIIVTREIEGHAFKNCWDVKVRLLFNMDIPLTVDYKAFEDCPGPCEVALEWKPEWENRTWEGRVAWTPEGTETKCFILGVKSGLEMNLALKKFMPDCVVNKQWRLCSEIHASYLMTTTQNRLLMAAVGAGTNTLCPKCREGIMEKDETAVKALSAKKAAAGAILAGPAGAIVGAAMGESGNVYVCGLCGHKEIGTANRGRFVGSIPGPEEFGIFEIKSWDTSVKAFEWDKPE